MGTLAVAHPTVGYRFNGRNHMSSEDLLVAVEALHTANRDHATAIAAVLRYLYPVREASPCDSD